MLATVRDDLARRSADAGLLARGYSGSARPDPKMLLFFVICCLDIRSSAAVQSIERNPVMRSARKDAGNLLDIGDIVQSNTPQAVDHMQAPNTHKAVVSIDPHEGAVSLERVRTAVPRLGAQSVEVSKTEPKRAEHEDLMKPLGAGIVPAVVPGTVAPPELLQKKSRFHSAPVHGFHPTPLHRHHQQLLKSLNSSHVAKEEPPAKSLIIGSSGVDPLSLAAVGQTPAPAAAIVPPVLTPAPAAATAPPAPTAAPAAVAASAPAPDSGGGGWLFFFIMIILIGGAFVAITFYVYHKMRNNPAASRLMDSARPDEKDSPYTRQKTAKHRQSVRKLGSEDHTDEEVSPRRASRSVSQSKRKSYSQTRKGGENVFEASHSKSHEERASASVSSDRGRRERNVSFRRSLSQPPTLNTGGSEVQNQSDHDGSQSTGGTPMSARERRDRAQQARQELVDDDDDERLVV